MLGKVLDLVVVGLAAEQVGGAQKVLDMAVEYAKVRVQFGRPIGSFQAIKHKCADMLLEVESAKSAAYYGMWCASEMNDELPSRRLARQGLLLRGVLPRRRREHPDPRRHRLHVGAPGAPLLQAGQELRAAVRRPDVPPRAAGPAHRHLTRGPVLAVDRVEPVTWVFVVVAAVAVFVIAAVVVGRRPTGSTPSPAASSTTSTRPSTSSPTTCRRRPRPA